MKKMAIFMMALLLVSATSVQADLVALLHLDGDATDSSGNNNHGTVNGGDIFVTGYFGQAIEIDEVHDYVEVGDVSGLRFGDGDSITIEAWIKPAAPTRLGVIVQKGGITSNATNYALRQDEGEQLAFFYRGTDNLWHGVRTTYDVLVVGEWNHVAATYNFGAPADVALYVDGTSQDVYWHWGNGNVDPQETSQSLQIGGSNIWRQKYYGKIDEVRIWDEALTKVPSSLPVDIDIKPGSDTNPINLGSNGLIPVAILTTEYFDATTVNPTSVALDGATVAVRGKGKYMAHEEDVNGDGYIDLIVQVETQGEDALWESGIVELNGTTYGGLSIVGYDEIIIVPPE